MTVSPANWIRIKKFKHLKVNAVYHRWEPGILDFLGSVRFCNHKTGVHGIYDDCE